MKKNKPRHTLFRRIRDHLQKHPESDQLDVAEALGIDLLATNTAMEALSKAGLIRPIRKP